MNAPLDLGCFLERVVNEALALVPGGASRLWVVEESRLALRAEAGTLGPPAAELLSLGIGEGLVGTVAATRELVVVDTPLDDPRTVHRDFVRDQRFVGFCGIPLVSADRVLGVLVLGARRPALFDKDTLASLDWLAQQAAVGLENALLHSEARRQLRENEALLSLSRALDGAGDLTETVRRVARGIAHALEADMVGVYLPEGEGAWLRPVAGYHVPGHLLNALRQTPFPVRGHAGIEEARQRGEPLWTSDAETDPRIDRATWARFPHRSTLLVPMLREGALIGVIFGIWWQAQREFSPRDLRLAAALGSQAAAVIEKARLHEESDRRRRHAEALADVARVISASLDPDEVGSRITESLRSLLGLKAARLWRLVPDTGRLELVVSTEGEAERGLEMPAGMGVSALAMRQRAVVTTPDLLADPRVSLTRQLRERIAELGHRSALVAPLLIQGQATGVLTASDAPDRVFSPEEIALVSAFAAQAALALDNARAHQALAVQAQRLKALARVTGLVSSSLSPEAVLVAIAEALVELTGAAVATIWSANEAARTVELVAASDPFLGAFPKRVMSYGEGLVGWVAAHRERLVAPDVLADGRSMEHDWWRGRALSAFLGVPVVTEGSLVAVLAVAAPRPFAGDADVLTVLDSFAAQAAIALKNARLYQEARQSEALLARERHVLELVAAGRPLHRILDEICHVVEALCDGALCSFLLLEPDGAHLRHGAAPSLPAEYCSTIDGMAIGPAAGSCGTAAFLKQPVIVADIASDPLWRDFRDLALAHGLAACWSVPVMPPGGTVLGTFAVYHRTPRPPTPAERALVARIANLATIAVERSEAARTRALLLEKVISVQEDERARIARELHDETAQSLAALALWLDGLKDVRSVGAARARAVALHEVALRTFIEVRHLAWGLRPSVLDDLGLVAAIERLAAAVKENRGLAVELRIDGMQGPRLPRPVETALYRIAQEALSNVVRHAGAPSARVALERSGSSVSLSVEDDGKGFDVDRVLSQPRAGDALGLAGMRERAAILGGTLAIESAPERGTRITVHIPIEEAARGQDQDPAG